jgi:hypothetical protein
MKYQQPCVSSLTNDGINEVRAEIEKIIKSSVKSQKVANL